MGFTCSVCGEYHDDELRDIRMTYPAPIYELDEEERAARAWLVDDFAVLDSKKLDAAIERWREFLAKNDKQKSADWFNGIIADYKSERRREWRKGQQSVNYDQYQGDYPDEE